MSERLKPKEITLETLLGMELFAVGSIHEGDWPDQIQRVPGGWILYSTHYVRENTDPPMHTSVFIPEPLLPIATTLRAEGTEDDWRLCPAELPAEAGFYQCTYKLPSGKRFVREDYFDGGSFALGELIEAWRPLPEPYTPGEDRS